MDANLTPITTQDLEEVRPFMVALSPFFIGMTVNTPEGEFPIVRLDISKVRLPGYDHDVLAVCAVTHDNGDGTSRAAVLCFLPFEGMAMEELNCTLAEDAHQKAKEVVYETLKTVHDYGAFRIARFFDTSSLPPPPPQPDLPDEFRDFLAGLE